MNKNEKSNYFLDETDVQTDYVTFYRRYTKIVWACELGLQTKALRSHIILEEPEVPSVKQGDDYLTIDFRDWASFFIKSTSAFRGDSKMRKRISKIVNDGLARYESKVSFAETKWDKDGKLSSFDINELFELYRDIDTFAVFNILIPVQYYNEKISTYGNEEMSLDDFLVSMVEPHRMLVRRNLLELALEKKKYGVVNEIKINQFLNNVCHTYFDEWLFSDSKVTEPFYLLRDISSITSNYSESEIVSELTEMKKRRQKKIKKFFSNLSYIRNAGGKSICEYEAVELAESLAFLSLIATEEEKRHMIECRYFLLIGRVLKALNIDVSRSSVKEIVSSAHMIWN